MPLLDPTPELMQQYRNVFSGPEGHIVLAHMIAELGVFSEDEGDNKDLRMYGARILSIIGGRQVNMGAIQKLIQGLMMQPLPKEQDEKE